MEQSRPNVIVRFVRFLWRTVDWSRRIVVNILFVVIMLALLGALAEGTPRVPGKAALVLDPKGRIVEQRAGDPIERAMRRLDGEAEEETELRDLLEAIDAAKDDDRIQALLLRLDGVSGTGPSKLQDLEAAIGRFKQSGKRVVAAGDIFLTGSYHLAAQADEIHLNPMGMVLPEGYGLWRPYYREGLDKYEIDVHVFRVGEFKSAVEPYLRNDVSPEARESYQDFLEDLWGSWLGDVAAARESTPEAIATGIEQVGEHLRAAGGDGAKMALDAGLVDHLSTRDQVRARMIELVGKEDDGESFAQIGFEDYLKAKHLRPRKSGSGDAVGVVVAAGTILDGTRPPGEIGGDSTAALIRQAREDEDVKALVLRVDSGGGSAFASEVIRRELEVTRGAGKPVVVSMGSVAASGGYWIATSADEVLASPDTITGSIGIFAVLPTIQKPLARYLGMHVDGVGTTWLSGSLRLDRELDPRLGDLIQQSIDHGYEQFLERVGAARKMTRDEVDAIARGRVWSGLDAKRIGLIDDFGDLDAAIASAARRGGIEGKPRVLYVEKEPTFGEQLVADLLESAVAHLPVRTAARGLSPHRLLRDVEQSLEPLLTLDDPHGQIAHCLCEVR